MKLFRRLLLLAGVLLLVVAGTGYYVHSRAMQLPSWYRKLEFDEPGRRAAANLMNQKLIQTFSAAREAQAAAARARGQNPSATPAIEPSDPIVIVFNEDEVNAFFATWDVRFHWKEKINEYLQDPVIVLENHEMILAATMKGWKSVVSLHLVPVLDHGKLRITLAEVTAGTLPLPQSAYSNYLSRMQHAMEEKLPELRKEADINSRGGANGSAVGAAMGELLIRTIRDESAEPVLFLPETIGHEAQSLPVEVIGVDVSNKNLTLTLAPMNAEQRTALLAHIRGESQSADTSK